MPVGAKERNRVPFTVIDEAIHVLDTAAEPWSIQFELGVEGRLDEERLRAAAHEALSRHPMALARLLPARRTDRTWQWEITSGPDVDPVRMAAWEDGDALGALRAEFYSLPVPLAESPPLRLRLARGPDHDLLMLNVNHAAFDGFGCLRFLHSVARAYTGVDDPPPPVSLEEARDVLRLLEAGDPTTRTRRLKAIAHKVTDVLRRPTPPAPDGGRDLPGYGFCHLALGEAETKTLSEPAQDNEDATVNDRLVAALHLTIDAWNSEHGEGSGRIGTLVPVNLRPKEWRQDVVTNLVLDARVATTTTDRSSPEVTLRAVVAESARIKEGGGAALVEVLGGSAWLPLWAKQSLSPFLWVTGNRLVDSAILSNLGQLDEPPSFGEEVGATREVWFSAPCRRPCAMSVGVTSVGGRMHLAFRYRHPVFGRTGARRFVGIYLSKLEAVAGA
jgi:NRPS condensation-like uncharacterized protein